MDVVGQTEQHRAKLPCQQLLPNVLLITECVRGEDTHWDAPKLSQNIRPLFSPNITKYLLFLHPDLCFGTGDHCQSHIPKPLAEISASGMCGRSQQNPLVEGSLESA